MARATIHEPAQGRISWARNAHRTYSDSDPHFVQSKAPQLDHKRLPGRSRAVAQPRRPHPESGPGPTKTRSLIRPSRAPDSATAPCAPIAAHLHATETSGARDLIISLRILKQGIRIAAAVS